MQAVLFTGFGAILIYTHWGDSMPYGFKIGAPIFLFLLMVAAIFTHRPTELR